MRTLVLLCFFWLSFAPLVDAQNFYSRRATRNWRVSLGAGTTIYNGDLNDLFFDKLGGTLGLNFGIGLRRYIGPYMSLSLNLNHYSISASDDNNGTLLGRGPNQRIGNRSGQVDTRFIRNLSFQANNFEGAFRVEFNLIPENRGSYRRPFLNPFMFVGLGLSTNNPKAVHPIEGKVNLRHLNTEALAENGYSPFVVIMPVGFGLRLKANAFIDIVIESGWRFTNSDYLDDVSGRYPSRDAIIEANRLGSIDQALVFFDRSEEAGFPQREEGDIRGNPDRDDSYYVLRIGLEFYLSNRLFKTILRKSRFKPKFR